MKNFVMSGCCCCTCDPESFVLTSEKSENFVLGRSLRFNNHSKACGFPRYAESMSSVGGSGHLSSNLTLLYAPTSVADAQNGHDEYNRAPIALLPT